MGREIIEKRIERKKQGSRSWKRARHFLKTEINRVLKKAIDGSFSPVLERLKNLKKGKRGVWSRSVNRKFNHWLYGYVLRRIRELCEVAGVQLYIVPSAYTSRTCPECGCQDKMNRNGEHFKCLQCGYEADVDIVETRDHKRAYSPFACKILPCGIIPGDESKDGYPRWVHRQCCRSLGLTNGTPMYQQKQAPGKPQGP